MASKLAELQGEIKNLQYQLKQNDKAREKVDKQYLALTEMIAKKEASIKLLSRMEKAITVSDHAFVRYMERQAAYPVGDLKKFMADKVEAVAGDALEGIFTVDGVEYRMKDRVIVTIL